jgi:hypothetical protein
MIVVEIRQLGTVRRRRQGLKAIEMGMNYAVMVVIGAAVDVLKRR